MKSFFLAAVLSFLFIWEADVFAQEYIYKQFTTADGLPSSEVYHVLQDSKGYIWFATDNGVSRYNGYEFENFDINDGLATNSTSEIYEDHKGRVWFIGMNSKLSYYFNDRIHQFKYNNLLENNLGTFKLPLKKGFYIDNQDNIYISIKSLGLIKLSVSGNIEKLSFPKRDTVTQLIYELENNIKIAVPVDNKTFIFNQLWIKNNSASIKVNLDISQNKFPHHLYLHQVNKHSFFYTSGEYFYIIEDYQKKASKKFDKDIIWANNIKEDGFWICTIEGGAVLFDIKKESIIVKKNLLKGKSVSSLIKDRNGGYWFSTLSSGVYYLKSFNLKVWNTLNNLDRNRVECVEANNDTIWIGYNNNTISRIVKNHLTHLNMETPSSFGIKDLFYDKKKQELVIASSGYLYFLRGNQIVTFKNNFKVLNIINRKTFTATCIIPDNSDGYWIGGGSGFFHFKNNTIDFDSRFNKNFRIRVNSILEDEDRNVWIGSTDGLRLFKNGKLKHLGAEFRQLNSNIQDIVKYDSALILATKGNGILIYNKSKVHKITQKEGLAANTVTSLKISDSIIWAGSLNGLSKLHLTKKLLIGEEKNCQNIRDLSSFEIFDIKIDGSKLYMATNKGLAEYEYNGQEKKINYPLFVKQIKINGKNLRLQEEYILDNEENSLTISYEALSYTMEQKIQYKYRLVGLEDNWIQTTERFARYHHLKPGNYEFNITVKNIDGEWQRPIVIKFKIIPSIFQTTPFKIALFLFIISILTLLTRARQKSNKYKFILKQNVYNYMNQAMKAQIHPHFIFNSLNSINKYVLLNNKREASMYLTKFSKLIRKILEHSQNESITLAEELYALELYLSIESIRLKDKFTYSIKVDDNLDPLAIKLPSLLLQPFVENSIWHGIQSLDKKGVIKVKISRKESNLEAEIIDNGIGRAKAIDIARSKRSGNKSVGIAITYKRLKLLAKKLNRKAKIEYTDLYSNGESIGTKVKISLPLIFNENIENQSIEDSR